MCVCVSVSVMSHLTSGASVRPENPVTYSAGNGGQKICWFFSETARLQRSSTPPLKAIHNVCTVSHFPAESARAYLTTRTCGSCHDLSSMNCHGHASKQGLFTMA